MACRSLNAVLVAAALASAVLVAPARVALGEEPAAAFLVKLRESGYFDLANEYLQRMEKSPAVSQEFRTAIMYEQGLTLMAVSRSETDFAKRQARLDEAQKKFEEFLVAQKNHDLTPRAKTELANVLVERGRVKSVEASRAMDPAAKAALLKEARAFFERGLAQFATSMEEIKKKLESLPKVLDEKKDASRIAYRDELRADYVKVQMVQAVMLYEIAGTAVDEKEKDELLKKAADAYGVIHEKYRRMLAGLYARLQQGRCYEEMGGEKNLTEALTYYGELLEQPKEPDPFRVLRTKTMLQAMQCWLADELKEKKLDLAITTADPWIKEMRPNETKDEDWLKLHYELARAYQLKAATLAAKAPEKGRYMNEARKLVEVGARYSQKELNEKFVALKAQLGGKIAAPNKKIDPSTFAEAMQAGRDGMQVIKESNRIVETLTAALPTAANAATKTGMQKQIADAEQARIDARFDTIGYFRKALTLVEPETTIDDVNLVRYYLSTLYLSQKDYYHAAAIGEFITRNYPGDRTAKFCATIARQSYLLLYNEAPEDARDFETDHVVGICQLVYEKWPNEPEAEDALITLLKFMVQPKQVGNTRMVPPENLVKAKEFLAKIPVESKRRGEAELTAGQAIWSSYLKGLQQVRKWETGDESPPDGVDIAARKTELDGLKSEAQGTLKNGIERMRQQGVDPTLVTAVLSLCQIYVDAEEADAAIALLEDKDIGPLTLVANNHEAVSREGFAEEAFKTGLRAYIGSLPKAADKPAMIAKAEGVMDAMNKRVGDDEAGKQKLVGIYVSLAKDVAKQIENAAPVNKKPLTQGFVSFLDKVSKSATQFAVMNWVAENFFEIGEANRPKSGEVPPDVEAFYDKAAAQYDQLIAKAKADATITPDMLTQLRLRTANVYRRQGKFIAAMDQFEEILKDPKRNAMLNVQVDAASTYMEWAASGGVPKLYLVASKGGRPNKAGRNNIWGWMGIESRLGKQVADYPQTSEKFLATLHEAKRKKAECNYLYALTQDDENRRKDFLQRAKDDIRLTYRSDQDLGGPTSKKSYDDLLKLVQTAMKEQPAGLEAFPQDAIATPAAGQPATDAAGSGDETAAASADSGGGGE